MHGLRCHRHILPGLQQNFLTLRQCDFSFSARFDTLQENQSQRRFDSEAAGGGDDGE